MSPSDMALAARCAGIQLLILDVDGVLTDGSIVLYAQNQLDAVTEEGALTAQSKGAKTVLFGGKGVFVQAAKGIVLVPTDAMIKPHTHADGTTHSHPHRHGKRRRVWSHPHFC